MHYSNFIRLIGILVAINITWACGPAHIKEYEPKERDYELPVDLKKGKSSEKSGSLWSQNDEANYLYADQRAIKKGDIVTVKVRERANAQRSADTSLNRSAELNANINAFLSAIKRLKGKVPKELANASSGMSFNSEGSTSRQQRLTATVPAIVTKSLPNGHFFIEGHRVILVNHEEHHFYVSGVARPHDIDEANTIPSSKLADAQIEFTGRGVLSEQNKPGFFIRAFGWMWPF